MISAICDSELKLMQYIMGELTLQKNLCCLMSEAEWNWQDPQSQPIRLVWFLLMSCEGRGWGLMWGEGGGREGGREEGRKGGREGGREGRKAHPVHEGGGSW